MPERSSNNPRAWIEFPDPADPAQLIRADLTWLTSRYHCIYGQGCQSIDSRLPYGGCCTMGAHFADKSDRKRVAKIVPELTADIWQRKPKGTIKKKDWVAVDEDGEEKTRVVDGACIFLNDPDFAGGMGCAFHILGQQTGRSHVELKPDVCWQLPIRRDYEERERADGEAWTVVVITEYVRGMWGAGGHDLDWYCSANTEAHTAAEPVYLNSKTELVALLGQPAYAELAEYCAQHEQANAQLVHLGMPAFAPHPADPDQ